jgi:uncharacterized membrane protein YsdA (DUF1294 family)
MISFDTLTLIFNALTPLNLCLGISILNLWTFMLFGFDKQHAEAGRWRIAESTLLGMALIGGSIGAYAGRAFFRHKTRKMPFSRNLHEIAIGQAFLFVIGLGIIASGWFG